MREIIAVLVKEYNLQSGCRVGQVRLYELDRTNDVKRTRPYEISGDEKGRLFPRRVKGNTLTLQRQDYSGRLRQYLTDGLTNEKQDVRVTLIDLESDRVTY